jgi:hypothetical protein
VKRFLNELDPINEAEPLLLALQCAVNAAHDPVENSVSEMKWTMICLHVKSTIRHAMVYSVRVFMLLLHFILANIGFDIVLIADVFIM